MLASPRIYRSFFILAVGLSLAALVGFSRDERDQVMMATKKEIVSTKQAPSAIGPYSQGVKVGNLLFTSGQIAFDPATGNLIEGGIKEQTDRVLKNIKAIVEAGGTSLANVIKTTVYLKDMNDFATMNAVYSEYFKENFPARSTTQASRLPKDVLIEIDAIAFTP